jgi:hypothetical protein
VVQAARQTRASDRPGPKADGIETDWLITSRPAERCSALQMAQADRAHGGIENGFHLRLDVTAGEDRSRVRHPTSVLNLAMIRRAALSLGIRWIQECRHRRQATLQGFYDAMASHHRRKALSLVTSSKASWLPTSEISAAAVRDPPNLACRWGVLASRFVRASPQQIRTLPASARY